MLMAPYSLSDPMSIFGPISIVQCQPPFNTVKNGVFISLLAFLCHIVKKNQHIFLHTLIPFFQFQGNGEVINLVEMSEKLQKKKENVVFQSMFNKASNKVHVYCIVCALKVCCHRQVCGTVCPKSSGPFYIVTYYIKRVTTSQTDGSC